MNYGLTAQSQLGQVKVVMFMQYDFHCRYKGEDNHLKDQGSEGLTFILNHLPKNDVDCDKLYFPPLILFFCQEKKKSHLTFEG